MEIKEEDLEGYHQYEIENLHTKHRKEYKLTYIKHKIYFDDDCRFCYTGYCTCEARWVLWIDFFCDFCNKEFRGYEELTIAAFNPTIEDFLREGQ